MVYYNQKEMRATGKEYTFSLRRPKRGWGVSPKKAMDAFGLAFDRAKKEYYRNQTDSASKNRKLFIALSHKYNKVAAKSLGWIYTATKNE